MFAPETPQAERRESLSKKISSLEAKVSEQDDIIANLKSELARANNLLEYEVNKYEKQIQGLRTGLVSNIQRHTKIVLEDIAVIASRIKQKEGEELYCWLDDLKGYFDSL